MEGDVWDSQETPTWEGKADDSHADGFLNFEGGEGWEEALGTSENIVPPISGQRGAGEPREKPSVLVSWEQVLAHIQDWEGDKAGEAHETLGELKHRLEAAWGMAMKDTEFVAGVPHGRAPQRRIWFEYGQGGDALTKNQATVLTWLEEGVKISWVSPTSAEQRKHPRYNKRLEQVLAKIRRELRNIPGGAAWLMGGDRPRAVVFPNRVSASTHAEFVRESLEDLCRTGALEEVSRDQVTTISGLGVAVNRKGKLRLVLDATYINFYDLYEGFIFKRLTDVPHYAKPADWVSLTDLKAGHHHFKVHPDDRQYLGVHFQEKYYRFVALPFGLSSACIVYTQAMQEVYAPLKARGARLTTYVDDALYLSESKRKGLKLGLALLLLLTWLGFTLSRGKCQLDPEQSGVFLGLVVDTSRGAFGVPAEKAQYILQA